MKRIVLLTLTALVALALAATATAAATVTPPAGELAQTGNIEPVAPAPLPATATATRKPRAQATRRLSFVMPETTSVFVRCDNVYWARWGGWEVGCWFMNYHQGVFTGDDYRYYYWDGGCWRFYEYFTRGVLYLGRELNPWQGPFYPAQRTCW